MLARALYVALLSWADGRLNENYVLDFAADASDRRLNQSDLFSFVMGNSSDSTGTDASNADSQYEYERQQQQEPDRPPPPVGHTSSGKCGSGKKCADEKWWEAFKILAEPVGIIVSSVVVLTVIFVVLVTVYYLRVINRMGGRYHQTVKLIVRGHAKAVQGELDEAWALYRRAALGLVHKLLSSHAWASHRDAEASETEAAAAMVLEIDKAVVQYNGIVGLANSLAFAFPWVSAEGCDNPSPLAGQMVVVDFSSDQGGIGVEFDGEGFVTTVSPGGTAEQAGVVVTDQLVMLDSERVSELSPETVQERLADSGSASFRHQVEEEAVVLMCSRCACRNHVGRSCQFFRCFSCRATALVWEFAMSPCVQVELSRSRCSRRRRPIAHKGYPHLQRMTWEESGLNKVPKHPTGFGHAVDVPADCKHHEQVGATCGVAAVNNLITNCSQPGIDAEHMMIISKQLGQAETDIRDGVQSVEEAGQEQCVAELYATSVGGHFDVQTLQIAFDEAGFNMWYVPPTKLQKPATLFECNSKHKEDLAGYVVHRKDPTNPRRDHWFVLRCHGDRPVRFLLQDSLFEKVFELTRCEAHQLLLTSPSGALFAVSKKPPDAVHDVPKSVEVDVPKSVEVIEVVEELPQKTEL